MTREEAIKEFEYGIISDEAVKMAIKALKQEPRKDEVILTKKEYGELVSSEFENGYAKGYREAMEEQETCEDAVSREAVLGLFNKSDMHSWAMSLLKRKIEEMPPVTPAVCIAKVTFNKDDLQELAKEKIKEITVEQRWIPVKERLPENTDYYLIQYSRKTCPDENAVAFYSVEEKESDPDYEWEFTPQCGEYKEVLAWMPLPEPYEGDKK